MTSDCLFRLDELCFGYHQPGSILDGLALQVWEGDRLAITGANGAGKSTLLHLMVGLKKPQSGTIEAFGRPRIHEADFFEVRARAGLLFQDPDDQLFCPTVFDDVAFGPLNLGKGKAESRDIVEKILSELSLSGLKDRVTHHLSGGEKRLVTLAAVLAMEPDVLLLDEPTNALDEETETRLIDILNRLDKTLLVVSHDQKFQDAVTTKRLRLKDGKLHDDAE